MIHLIKYRVRSIMREKTTFFWSFAFSFILVTLFYMAFSNVSSDKLDTIHTALVMEDESREAVTLKTVLNMMGESEEGIISVKEMSRKKAEKKLEEESIKGVFFAGKETSLLVAENGMEQSVLQSILQQFQSKMNYISDVGREKPEKLSIAAESIMKNAGTLYVEEGTLGGEKPDSFVQYYLALIAMTCLFASYLGMDIAMQLQANVGAVGARRMVAPTKKMKIFLCDVGTVFVADCAVVVVLLCYIKYILKIEIGDDWGKLLLTIFVGCLLGVCIGVLIGSMPRLSVGAKNGILTAVGLVSSFLSGLMIGGIKGAVEDVCPIVNRLNPASVITDALFSIKMYPDDARFYRDILILGILAFICFGTVIIKMRRVRYDSI